MGRQFNTGMNDDLNSRQTNFQQNSEYDEVLPHESLLEVFLRHRWAILLTTIIFLVIAFFYLLKATPIYTSTARVYVEQSGPKIISEYEGFMTQSKNYLHTQSELVTSTPIVSEVVKDGEVRKLKTFRNIDNPVAYIKKNLEVTVGKKDDIITASFDSPYSAEAAQIVNAVVDSYVEYHSKRKRSTVSEVVRLLQKEKIKRDEELSKQLGKMVDFTRDSGVIFSDNAEGHIAFQRLAKLSEALTETQLEAVDAKVNYEAATGMSNDPAKVRQFAMAQNPRTSMQMAPTNEEVRLREELADLEIELKHAMRFCTQSHPSIKATRARIDHIKEKLAEYEKKFVESYIEAMRQGWIAAELRKKQLLSSYQNQEKEAQNVGVKAAEFSVLKSELNRSERICEILDNRIKELNVTEDTGALNISILEVARPEDFPSKPQKAKVMAVALVLGLAFGFFVGLFRDWRDYKLCSAKEISSVLRIPVLGVVPSMTQDKGITAHGHKAWFGFKPLIAKVIRGPYAVMCACFSKDTSKRFDVRPEKPHGSRNRYAEISTFTKRMQLRLQPVMDKVRRAVKEAISSDISRSDGNDSTDVDSMFSFSDAHRAGAASTSVTKHRKRAKRADFGPSSSADRRKELERKAIVQRGTQVLLKPTSIVAEAYRTIRTSVFFGVPDGQAKTIVVTSPAPGDGKSTLVSNLGIAMAQAGQKTLVIDGDFRRPVQNKIFEISAENGLSNVLSGSLSAEEAIQSGSVEGLDILACGQEVPNPSELLNSSAFIDLLSQLSERYDRILIDSPPVMPVADSQILGAVCDITLLVLRAEKSTKRLSQHARDSLVNVGARILGAIVNGVPLGTGRYGYYRGYGYYRYGYYGYGYSRKRDKQEPKQAPEEQAAYV